MFSDIKIQNNKFVTPDTSLMQKPSRGGGKMYTCTHDKADTWKVRKSVETVKNKKQTNNKTKSI